VEILGVAEFIHEDKKDPHPSPLPRGEGIRIPAPFSLGRRAGDEGKALPYSAVPNPVILGL
jgi:hypothetical protein